MFNRQKKQMLQQGDGLENSRYFSLNAKIILAVLLSAVLSIVVFAGFRFCVSQIIMGVYSQVYEKQADAVRSKLITAIYEQGLSLDDDEALQNWLDENSEHVSIALYDNKGMYVISTSERIFGKLYPFSRLDEWLTGYDSMDMLTKEYPFTTKYGLWTIILYGYIPSWVLKTTFCLELAAAVCAFLFTFLRLTRNRLNYLLQLEQEIQRMENGDLDHEIPVASHDQLSRLAKNLDSLRQTLRDRILTEAEAKKANNELITAMSHDLRTPLTALMGYLEIVETHRYQTPEQLEKYLKLSNQKACQIKELSDRLFQYFLFSDADEILESEPVDGQIFLTQMLGESLLSLQDLGFEVETDFLSQPVTLMLNPPAMRRILDNLCSNVNKYADPNVPVTVSAQLCENRFLLQVTNGISASPSPEKSYGIGLKSCRRLAEKQGGAFRTSILGDHFAAQLELPT